jgi:hypothetical protein
MYFVDLEKPAAGRCGCHPRTMRVGAHPLFRVWGTVDDCPIIPRSEWKTVSMRDRVWEIVNQADQNSCCPSATRGGMQLLREICGMTRTQLSQGSLYGQVNDGRDQGANIMDALEALMKVGIAPTSIIDQYQWHPNKFPSRWQDHAAKYRLLEADDCPTFDAMVSAIQRPYPVVFGVNWAGGGGHAILGVGYDKEANAVEILNSWDKTWGDGGFGFLTEKQCKAITTYGAFALRSPVLPSGEELPPAI